MAVTIDGVTLATLLPADQLIRALKEGFASAPEQPERTHLDLDGIPVDKATLLLMPAWNERFIGVKTATIFPTNVDRGIPSVFASYLLKDALTGKDLAVLDGTVLTRLRTAAASALASSFLSRPEASSLLMIGAGSLAAPLIRAHAALRPLSRIMVWNRSIERVQQLRAELDMDIEPVRDLGEACGQADIISSATLSTTPLILGEWVLPGTHIDLVGAYRSDMRESDTYLIRKADVFVDTHPGSRQEAGDLMCAAADGGWSFESVVADLATLCREEHPGRTRADAITVFKSVGASLEDLVAAGLAWDRMNDAN